MFQYKLLHRILAFNQWLCKIAIGLKAKSKCIVIMKKPFMNVNMLLSCEGTLI